jgi:geranylgeranyl diphosphate synthase type 3
MYFIANQTVMRLTSEHGGDAHKAAQTCLEEMIQLHRGQGIEIYWRSHQQKPTIGEYLKMVARSQFPAIILSFSSLMPKFEETGGLLRLGVRLLALHPDAAGKEAIVSSLIKLGERLGVYYQIRDDHVNLISDEYAALNGFAEDLHEGKYSFPIIHSLDVDPRSGLAGDFFFFQKKRMNRRRH